MNKAVHALVYVILAVAGVALYFELNLFEKKELLKDSNEQLRNCIVKLSSFIEAEDAAPGANLAAKKDVSPREAREVDDPETENLLEDYHPEFEKTDVKLMKWGDSQAAQLRKLYALDSEGNKQPDQANPGRFVTKGPGTAQELVDSITDRASKQYEKLGKTRQELASVRAKLQKLVTDYNELPKEIRLDRIELEKRAKEIEKLTSEKTALEDQLQKTKAEVEDLKTEVTSLKDEVATAKDETEAVKEDLEKERKKVEHLTNLLKTQTAAPRAPGTMTAGGGQLTNGNKGTISKVNNEKLYVVVKFEDAALDELLGADRSSPLTPHEMYVVRNIKGADGKETKTIVGKIRLRQWTPNTNFVLAQILKDFSQDPLVIEEGDAVITD